MKIAKITPPKVTNVEKMKKCEYKNINLFAHTSSIYVIFATANRNNPSQGIKAPEI